MAGRIRSIFKVGKKASVSQPVSSAPRPGAAVQITDAESGNEGEDPEKALYALTVMRDRGLISADEFERRKAALAEEG